MLVLLGIGFLAGIVTAISPCVLPVLPILLAGGASGRKPLRIVAGLVLSFTVFTLFAAWLLDKLGLPADFLRNLAIALLFLLALTLLVPQVALWVERPFARLTRLRPQNAGGGFLLGASLGLVFVPCAGPVLATVTVVAANNDVGVRALLLTLSYALGAAGPMLLVAYGGTRAAGRLRTHAQALRTAAGALIALVALGLVVHADDHLATLTPGYTDFLQKKIESSHTAQRELRRVRGEGGALAAAHATTEAGLPDYGEAPGLVAGGRWFNSRPLTMRQLRGKVVLIDFWTYSCINCLRTLPHLEAWDATYRRQGLVIVGVHTPEFAFEHEASNVSAAIHRLGVRYPTVQDNDYGTWNAYGNQYWPAEYLVDKQGHVRHAHFGEGQYGETEQLIRRLLAAKGTMARQVADTTPKGLQSPETYLGLQRAERYQGSPLAPNRFQSYRFPPSLAQNGLAYAGSWKIESERAVAGRDARLRFHFLARNAYLVLGGKGTVQVLVNGKPERTVRVDAYRLYTLRSGKYEDALLELRFSPGLQGYAFTFG
jgi:cytochrome c biogenesis protein CcdA/thiol-disulfide isomerase/thioredoxin